MEPEKLRQRYWGPLARSYDADREKSVKWSREQHIVANFLKQLPRGSRILDIPVGTGRFIEIYKEYGLNPTGMDVSVDMLERAKSKVDKHNLEMPLVVSDIRAICAHDREFDCAVCIRFLNWVDTRDLREAVLELARVSKVGIILGVRHYQSVYDIRPYRGFRNCLRLIRQVRRRLMKRDGLIFHEKGTIADVFRQAKMNVVRSSRVEERRDGTEYHIYWLEKEYEVRS